MIASNGSKRPLTSTMISTASPNSPRNAAVISASTTRYGAFRWVTIGLSTMEPTMTAVSRSSPSGIGAHLALIPPALP